MAEVKDKTILGKTCWLWEPPEGERHTPLQEIEQWASKLHPMLNAQVEVHSGEDETAIIEVTMGDKELMPMYNPSNKPWVYVTGRLDNTLSIRREIGNSNADYIFAPIQMVLVDITRRLQAALFNHTHT